MYERGLTATKTTTQFLASLLEEGDVTLPIFTYRHYTHDPLFALTVYQLSHLFDIYNEVIHRDSCPGWLQPPIGPKPTCVKTWKMAVIYFKKINSLLLPEEHRWVTLGKTVALPLDSPYILGQSWSLFVSAQRVLMMTDDLRWKRAVTEMKNVMIGACVVSTGRNAVPKVAWIQQCFQALQKSVWCRMII